MSEKRDTLPAPPMLPPEAPPWAHTMYDQITAMQRDISLIVNYLRDRQVHGVDRVQSLPPIFEAVPDDDTPTNPGS